MDKARRLTEIRAAHERLLSHVPQPGLEPDAFDPESVPSSGMRWQGVLDDIEDLGLYISSEIKHPPPESKDETCGLPSQPKKKARVGSSSPARPIISNRGEMWPRISAAQKTLGLTGSQIRYAIAKQRHIAGRRLRWGETK